MSDNSSLSPAPLDAGSLGRTGAHMPDLEISASVRGPCFTVQVEALREGNTLLVRRIQVTGFSIDGIPRALYSFEASIDDPGVAQLSPLLMYAQSTQDVGFLHKLLQITDAYSAGNWEPKSVPATDMQEALLLEPAIPSFEVFCKDPGILSREFWSVRRGPSTDVSDRLKAKIAAWGEFLEIQLYSGNHGTPAYDIPTSYYKVLLPDDPHRAYNQAYSELKRLLLALAQAFSTDGHAGILRFLKAGGYEVLVEHYRFEASRYHLQQSAIASGFVPTQDDIEMGPPGNRLKYNITAGTATVVVTSTADESGPSLHIEFSQNTEGKHLAAAQIRCVTRLVECIREQRWSTRDDLESLMLQRIFGLRPIEGHKSGSSKQTPREDALSAISISFTATPSDLRCFFSERVISYLDHDTRCIVSKDLHENPEVRFDICRGSHLLLLQIAPDLSTRRPELFSRLLLRLTPEKIFHVQATTSLGSSVIGKIQMNLHKYPAEMIELGDRLYELFRQQEEDGWYSLYSAISAMSTNEEPPSETPPLVGHFPSVENPFFRQSVDRAGQFVYLINRGETTPLTATLLYTAPSGLIVRLQSLQKGAAVDIAFKDAVISRIDFYSVLSSKAKSADLRWLLVGSLERSLRGARADNVSPAIAAVRRYFRDLQSADALVHADPTRFVVDGLAKYLAGHGFAAIRER